MVFGKFPLGHSEIIPNSFGDLSGYFRIIQCRVLPPQNISVPKLTDVQCTHCVEVVSKTSTLSRQAVIVKINARLMELGYEPYYISVAWTTGYESERGLYWCKRKPRYTDNIDYMRNIEQTQAETACNTPRRAVQCRTSNS